MEIKDKDVVHSVCDEINTMTKIPMTFSFCVPPQKTILDIVFHPESDSPCDARPPISDETVSRCKTVVRETDSYNCCSEDDRAILDTVSLVLFKSGIQVAHITGTATTLVLALRSLYPDGYITQTDLVTLDILGIRVSVKNDYLYLHVARKNTERTLKARKKRTRSFLKRKPYSK